MRNDVTCGKCGRVLAQHRGELGVHGQFAVRKGVRVSIQKNALGEDIGWMRCSACRARTQVRAAYLPRARKV